MCNASWRHEHNLTGDKLGEQNLHLYWADFVDGLGTPDRIFRKVKLELLAKEDLQPSSTTTTSTTSTSSMELTISP